MITRLPLETSSASLATRVPPRTSLEGGVRAWLYHCHPIIATATISARPRRPTKRTSPRFIGMVSRVAHHGAYRDAPAAAIVERFLSQDADARCDRPVKPRRGGFAQRSATRGRPGALNRSATRSGLRAPLRKASASRLHASLPGGPPRGFFNLTSNSRDAEASRSGASKPRGSSGAEYKLSRVPALRA